VTKEQQVAIDAMREAWPADVVERMLRAEAPAIEATALAARAYVEAHDDPNWRRLLTGEERLRLSDALERTFRDLRNASEADSFVLPFSPSETPAGASSPQPRTGTDHLHEPGCYARPFPEGRAGTCSCRIGTSVAPPPGHGPTPGTGTPPEV
jgi:hypothetical protein